MIRNATLEDIPEIIKGGLSMVEETSYKHVDYSPERVEATCKLLMAQGFIMVAEKNGEVVGAMLGDVYTPWYTTDSMGIDYCIYIKPEHRNGMIAARLIKRFEEWCIAMGAKQIRPGIGTGNKNVSRLYKALGYRVVGECFLKDIEND
jgi:L-amino acid N-acyltransferase YncA